MDDRTLLEKAARAAGIALDYTIRPDGKAFFHTERNAFATADGGWFCPLDDDGQALRLAVKLKIDLIHNEPQDNNEWVMAGNPECVEEVDGEISRAAATRRAITRAAAALGEKE